MTVAATPGSFDPVENFEDFFRFYQEEPNKFKYREKIHELYSTGGNTIIFHYEDLLDYDPKLAHELYENPEKILDDAKEAFKNLLRIESGGAIDESIEYFVRVETEKDQLAVSLRGLRAEHIDKLVCVHGILVRATPVKPQIITATFECQDCGHQFELEQFDTILVKPAKCMNPGCKNKNKFILVSRDSKFIDWQSIHIQESPEELPAGRIPRAVQAILTHNLVERARPGDRVKIIGVYRSVPQENARGTKSTIFKTFIQVNNLESKEDETDNLHTTDEELQEILRLAKEPMIQKKIGRSIAPSIMGMEHIKMAAALLLFGGVAKVKPDGGRIRGDIHVLTVGDPGVGKSQILHSAYRLSPRGVFTSGKGSSAAGLTAAVIKDADTGGMSLEAGAVVLADGGIACIDEFDKMRNEDRVAIHEAMEQQTVSIAKAGIVATLNSRTSILAAANPHLGRYNPWKTASDNIRLSPPLLSRFDLIFVVIDKPDAQTDRDIANFILDLHMQAESLKSCESEENKEDATIPVPKDIIRGDLLKKYIHYARKTCKPRLTPAASKKISDFYLKMRAQGGDENAAIAMVARNLEGIIRLSEAHAKMALKDTVDEEDVEAILELVMRSLQDIGFDKETGAFDIDRLMTGHSRSQVSKIGKVLEILRDMEEENGNKPVELDALKERVLLEGELKEEDVEEALKTLKREGDIIYPKNGLVKSVKH